MKRALLPVLFILTLIALLTVVTRWYEQRWGLEGPFPPDHHHH
jgi:hypothetical protein